jgi:hypothetical protein
MAAWRNFCSRTCSGEYAQASQSEAVKARHTARLLAWNREQTKRRVIGLIRAVLGEGYRDGDPVQLAHLIRVAQLAWAQGAHVQQQRHRQKAKAAAA